MLDSRKELLDQIRLGEDSSLELKEVRFRRERVSGPPAKNLANELAAFANGQGGVCVLGVSDRPREVVGIPMDRLDTVVGFVRHVCTELIDPGIAPIVDRLWLPSTTGEDLAVVKVEVRPSLFVHRSPGGYLHRVADQKRAMAPDVLSRLFQQRSQTRLIRFDEQVVAGATLENLSPERWKRFRTSRTGDDRDTLLSKLHMARRDEGGVLRPTVSGVLMASADPREWLPNAFVQAVAYHGTDVRPQGWREAYQMDASDLFGPLDHQVEEACRFVARNMKVVGFKEVGRVDRPQFDMAAVFEAMVNAVAHRDYSIHGSKIRLRLFDDRLEIYSPGSIINSMTADDLVHLQASRNEVLTSLLAKCPVPADVPWLKTNRETLMDRRGEGVRIILENSHLLSGREPEYRAIGDAQLLLTIYAARRNTGDE